MKISKLLFPLVAILIVDQNSFADECGDFIQEKLDSAISDIAYTQKVLAEKKWATHSMIPSNPLLWDGKKITMTVDSMEQVPLPPISADVTRTFSPIQSSSEITSDKGIISEKFPEFDLDATPKYRLEILTVSATTTTIWKDSQKKSQQKRTINLFSLFEDNKLVAYKKEGLVTYPETEGDENHRAPRPYDLNKVGAIFEYHEGRCLLKRNGLTKNFPLTRDDCVDFYRIVGDSDHYTDYIEYSDGTKKNFNPSVCYLPSEMISRGESPKYITQKSYSVLSSKNKLKKLDALISKLYNRFLDSGNLAYAESIEPQPSEVVKGCKPDQFKFGRSISGLDSLCKNYKTFLPYYPPAKVPQIGTGQSGHASK